MKTYEAAAIRRAVGFADLVEPVADAYRAFSRGLGESPIMVFAPAGESGDVHVKAAWLPDRDMFTVKVASWFTARSGSAGSGYVAVHDAHTGDLRAILLDEHHLTDVRTAAAGAVAARLLAPARARTLAVFGTGVQAYLQVLAHASVRPVSAVLVWGRRPAAASRLRDAVRARLPHLAVTVVADPRSAAEPADMIVTATASREPVLRGAWLRPGQHVTAVGADDPSKVELDAECFARADLVAVDGRAFAGDQNGRVELGELLSDAAPPAAGLTIARLIGLGVLDLAAAELTLRRLDSGEFDPAPPASAADLVERQQ